MSLLDNKIVSYTDNIKELPDRPSDEGISAEALKAIFDGRTDNEVKGSINNIIDELTAPEAAAQIGADISGITAKNIQGVLDSFQGTLNAHDQLLDEDMTALMNRYTKSETDALMAGKADKVVNVAAGDIAALDVDGNLASSGYTLRNMLATTVLSETSSANSLRTISIPGITNYSQLLNIPIVIRSNVNGAAGTVSVNINSLGVKSVSFPDDDGVLADIARDGWVAVGQDYTVTFNGVSFIISSVNSVGATVSRAGLVRLNNSVTSTSEMQAATAKAVKTVYDLTLTKPGDAPNDGAQYGRQNGTWTPITGGGGGGTSDHSQLTNRNLENQHPMEAITGISEEFNYVWDAMNKHNSAVTVHNETSSSATVRTVTVADVPDMNSLINVPLNIRSKAGGTTATTTLNVNGLGAKDIVFPNPSGNSLVTYPPSYDWVRTGSVYSVVYDGTQFVLLNFQPREASVNYRGIVQLNNTVTSTSQTMAATASAVRLVNDTADLALYMAESTITFTTLTAAEWIGTTAPYIYVFNDIEYVTPTSVNEILPQASILEEQLAAYQNANIQDGGQAGDTILLKAWGTKPVIDIPICIIVRRDL